MAEQWYEMNKATLSKAILKLKDKEKENTELKENSLNKERHNIQHFADYLIDEGVLNNKVFDYN